MGVCRIFGHFTIKNIFITFNFKKSMHMDICRLFIKLNIIMILKIEYNVKNLKIYRNQHLSHLWSFFEKKKHFNDFQFIQSMHMDIFRIFLKLTIITIFKNADVVKNNIFLKMSICRISGTLCKKKIIFSSNRSV